MLKKPSGNTGLFCTCRLQCYKLFLLCSLAKVWSQKAFKQSIPALNTIYRWLKEVQNSNRPVSNEFAADDLCMEKVTNVLAVDSLPEPLLISSLMLDLLV